MKKIAFLFPGQGSQYVGMGKDIYPLAKSFFDEADEIVGKSLTSIMFNGTEDVLRQTENTQPAVLMVSCALCACAKERGLAPAIVAGHSLGEYSALFAAGVLPYRDIVKLVNVRSQYIRDASRKNPGSMAAIIGASVDQINELIKRSDKKPSIEAVNYNCPGQIVVAGTLEALVEAEQRAQKMGIKMMRLNVSGPFHSSLMHEASERMKKDLNTASFHASHFPVVTNVDAECTDKPEALRDKLARQINHPVLWEKTIRAMLALNVEIFVEIGPGKVLNGLNKKIDRTINTFNIENIQTLEKTLESLNVSINS